MGSLLPGWDSKRHKTPKSMRDFEEPTRMSVSPKSTVTHSTSGPPHLNRSSAPPSYQVKILRTSQPEPINVRMSASGDPPAMLSRHSVASVSPSSPRHSTSMSSPTTSAQHPSMFSRLLESKDDSEDGAISFSTRMESSALNQKMDERGDLEAWRRSSFQPADPMHSMHIMDVSPSNKSMDGG